MSYSKSHVILIAFAIDTPDSLENVTVKVRLLLLDPRPHSPSTVDRRGPLHLRPHHPRHPRRLQV